MSPAAPTAHSSAVGQEKGQAAPRPTGVPPTHPPVFVPSAGTRTGSHTPLPSACGHLHNFNKLVTGSCEVGVSGSRGGGGEGNSNELYSDPGRNGEQGWAGEMVWWVKVPRRQA